MLVNVFVMLCLVGFLASDGS